MKSTTTPRQKPRLDFWQIWNMSFGFFGIQFGWALQLANGSRIFQSLGAEVDKIAILWIAAPVTGLLVQPIIGYLSDRTWNRLGRRKPYFLVGAVLASLGLLVMPYSPTFWFAAGMLWILDASINISMEPFRAFVGDMLPSEQRTQGFAMQSFFIGTGSVIASMLPFLLTNLFNVENTAPEGTLPDSLKISFILGGIIFLAAVLWTIFRTQEYSPEEMAAFEGKDVEDTEADTGPQLPANKYYRNGLIWAVAGLALTAFLFYYNGQIEAENADIIKQNAAIAAQASGVETPLLETRKTHKEPLILGFGLIVFGLLQIIAGSLTQQNKIRNGLVEIMNDLFHMPRTMGQLAWVQAFTWFGLFSMFLYMTPAVTSYVYGTTDPSSDVYNKGADWVGVLFAVYNGAAALFALILTPLAKRWNKRTVHALALTLGGLGLASVYLISNPDLLVIPMIGMGFAWASILAMPYALLTDSIPSHKFGIYMGIFNFFIVLPEIVASTIYGVMLSNLFENQSIWVLVTGGFSMFIAAILVMRVDEVE